jgi:multidrug efflux pump subunit AcrA (membrane-fusion protein)
MTMKITFWIAIVVLMIGVGLYGCSVLTPIDDNQDEVGQSSSMETAVARTGDLTILASGSGEVIPDSEIGLTFDESGVVMEVLVGVGDQVQAGDVLARLQTDKTQAELDVEITQAKLSYVQAQQDLDNLYKNAEIEAAKTLMELEEAQIALVDVMDLQLEIALAESAVVQAEKSIEDAEMLMYIYNSSPSDDAVYTAYASLLFKQAELEKLQTELVKLERKIKWARDERTREMLESQILQLNVRLADQQVLVEDATYRLNSIDDAADPLDVSVAEAQLRTAQAQLAAAQKELAELENGPNPGTVAKAEAQLKQAQAGWENIKDGPDPEEIARLETELESARLELEIIQQRATTIDLVAPIDGIVTKLNVAVGDRYNSRTGTSSTEAGTSGPQSEMEMIESFLFGNSNATAESDSSLVTIADMSQPLLEVYLDETDYQKAVLGYPVEVTFDALPGDKFTGEIVEISPQLERVSNVQGVPMQVRLDAASYAKPIPLPIGLNATVDVIAGQTENAVLIPIEALVEVSPEKYLVYVVENEVPQPKEVSIGLMDFTTVEIIAGINPGEVVAIGYDEPTGN